MFADSLTNSTFSTGYIDKLTASANGKTIFDTMVYNLMTTSSNYINNSSQYESAEKTVEIMNKSLADKNAYLLEGKYLPWFVNNEGKPDLKFDASEEEMYSIP